MKGIVRVLFGPGSDEGNTHPAFVVSSFFAAQGSGAGDLMGWTNRGVSSVVSEEDHEGIIRHAEFVEVIEDVAEGLIEALEARPLSLPLVVRLTGTNEHRARQILAEHGMESAQTMDEAVEKAVAMAGGQA